MTMDRLQRRLLIEQSKREILDSLKQYQVGWCHGGEIIATKDSGNWHGYLFVIPGDVYKSFFPDAISSVSDSVVTDEVIKEV